jgi:hypothetical protein
MLHLMLAFKLSVKYVLTAEVHSQHKLVVLASLARQQQQQQCLTLTRITACPSGDTPST